MLRKEIFLLFLEKLNKKEDLKSFIDGIEDNTLKETIIFTADEFLQNSWDDLIEKKNYNTACGGEKFFTNIEHFISDKNYEMLQICLSALKLGFKGAKNDTSQVIKKIQNFLSIEPRLQNLPRENFSQKSERIVSLFSCIVPFALIYCVAQIFQAASIKLIHWRIK
jgi:hypothetical protein